MQSCEQIRPRLNFVTLRNFEKRMKEIKIYLFLIHSITMKRKGLAKDGKIRRKIKAINYTRDIALPKDWVRDKGLDSGDEVELSMTESGDLLVTPANKRSIDG